VYPHGIETLSEFLPFAFDDGELVSEGVLLLLEPLVVRVVHAQQGVAVVGFATHQPLGGSGDEETGSAHQLPALALARHLKFNKIYA
jgi:hypothetical protein